MIIGIWYQFINYENIHCLFRGILQKNQECGSSLVRFLFLTPSFLAL